METRMTEQAATPPATPEAPKAPTPTPPAVGDRKPPWGDDANFNPEEAWKTIQNLRKEKGGPDPALRTELDTLKQQQAQRDAAMAAALGIKPDEASDTDKLAQQVGTLQQQILASERRALAAEHKVPEALLTGTDADAMKAQALALVEFAQGAHVAASTATPAFQANPGQGQGNAPLSSEAQAAAEYEKFYPPVPK